MVSGPGVLAMGHPISSLEDLGDLINFLIDMQKYLYNGLTLYWCLYLMAYTTFIF